ncbi:MAG: leucine-rich repeat domain-containing protein, partial [Candidatus Thorarchaeota archaeon]
SPLEACRDLYSINISNSNLKELDLSPLEKNKNLRYLTLDSNHLTVLDLSPLSANKSLSTLSLENNALPELDLSPLSSCVNLQYLEIGGNALSEIDLSALAEIKQLRKLKMESNRLKEIDLEPLKRLKHLYDMNLGGNRIHSLDLSPLSRLAELQDVLLHGNRLSDLNLNALIGCKQLCQINLTKNLLKTIDITGLLCTKSESLVIQVDSDVVVQADAMLRSSAPPLQVGGTKYESVIEWRPLQGIFKDAGWKETVGKIKTFLRCLSGPRRFSARKAVLEELGMSEISGLDRDFIPILESAEGIKSFKKIRLHIYDEMIDLLRMQIEEGGSTFFLDVEAMKGTPSEALTELILERRIEEVNSTVIPIKKGRAYLEPLWLTHYGFETLSYLDMPLKNTSEEKFKLVRKRLKELGLKPRTKRFKTARLSKKYSVKMSRELKQYILSLASEA